VLLLVRRLQWLSFLSAVPFGVASSILTDLSYPARMKR
jgi:hypothetical protein